MSEKVVPFAIRGHRLDKLRKFLEPELLSWAGDEDAKPRDVGEIVDEYVKAVQASGWSKYIVDVLGDTSEDLDIFRQRFSQVILRFLTLPDDYPVRIFYGFVGDYKDEVCKSCVVGNHCECYETRNNARPIYCSDGHGIKKHFGWDSELDFITTLGEVKRKMVKYGLGKTSR